MANPGKVILKVNSVSGTYAAGHKAGQEFDLSQDFALGVSGNGQALCPSAFYAAYPYWRVLRFKGKLAWEKDKDKAHVACPDPFNRVALELKIVKE
jgi:uncharacterized repeat protein (TIGR04076 family)